MEVRGVLLKKVFCESILLLFYWIVSMRLSCLVGVHPILIFIFLICVTGVSFKERGFGGLFRKNRLTRENRDV